MIFKIKDAQVAVMSETPEEALTLLKLSRAKEAVDKEPTLAKKRGKKAKYHTIEERRMAQRKAQRRWYRRNKARLALARSGGTPVTITKVVENNG